jgi:drug/metabolite transporter (DMT)-like permease
MPRRWGVSGAVLLPLLVAVLWAGGFTASRVVVDHAPLFTIAAVRYLLATACLFALLLALDQPRLPETKPSQRDWAAIVALALTAVVLYNVLFLLAISWAPSSDGLLLVPTTNPAWTVLFAFLLIGERPTQRLLLAIAVVFVGVSLVLIGGYDGALTGERFLGNLLFLAAAVVFGLSNVVGRVTIRAFSPLAATAWSSLIGGAVLIPLAAVQGGVQALLDAPSTFWVLIVFIAIGSNVVAYVLWYRSIALIGAGRTSFYTNLLPVFGLVFAMVFLGESPNPLQLLGGIVIAGAVVWSSRAPTTIGEPATAGMGSQ